MSAMEVTLAILVGAMRVGWGGEGCDPMVTLSDIYVYLTFSYMSSAHKARCLSLASVS